MDAAADVYVEQPAAEAAWTLRLFSRGHADRDIAVDAVDERHAGHGAICGRYASELLRHRC